MDFYYCRVDVFTHCQHTHVQTPCKSGFCIIGALTELNGSRQFSSYEFVQNFDLLKAGLWKYYLRISQEIISQT